jgi:hypothetical protein
MPSRKLLLGLGIVLTLVGVFLIYGSTYDSLVNFLASAFHHQPKETGIQVCMGGALCPNPWLTVRLALLWSGLASLITGILLLGYGALHQISQTKLAESTFNRSETARLFSS